MELFILICALVAIYVHLVYKSEKPQKKKTKGYKPYIKDKITPEARTLYAELIKLEISAVLERFDGHKTVDISIPDARIDIEVDGTHHNTNPIQAIADLKRTYYSLIDDYYTIRIPNSLIQNNLRETVDYITRILDVRLNAIKRESKTLYDYSEMLESDDSFK